MTNIECTNCSEVMSVEASSVTLPYVCAVCEQDAENYDAMAPGAVSAPTTDLTALMSNGPEPSHDATVENTTLLIEDLEEQLAFTKSALDKSTKLIETMSAQLEEYSTTIADKSRYNYELSAENQSFEREVAARPCDCHWLQECFRQTEREARHRVF